METEFESSELGESTRGFAADWPVRAALDARCERLCSRQNVISLARRMVARRTSEVMRISHDHFVRMLHGTPSVEAVAALAGNWSPRAKQGLSRFGLAAPEYAVTLSLIYSGEVGNGGHCQFFLNRGGRIAREVLVALDTVGLSQAREILSAA